MDEKSASRGTSIGSDQMGGSSPESVRAREAEHDPVNKPSHYRSHPSGIECIQITEHMGFNLGNAFKYIWRCDLKKDAIEDLKKAVWYAQREIAKREREAGIISNGSISAKDLKAGTINTFNLHAHAVHTEADVTRAANASLFNKIGNN